MTHTKIDDTQGLVLIPYFHNFFYHFTLNIPPLFFPVFRGTYIDTINYKQIKISLPLEIKTSFRLFSIKKCTQNSRELFPSWYCWVVGRLSMTREYREGRWFSFLLKSQLSARESWKCKIEKKCDFFLNRKK